MANKKVLLAHKFQAQKYLSTKVLKYEWQINSKHKSAKVSIIVPRHSQRHIYTKYKITMAHKCQLQKYDGT